MSGSGGGQNVMNGLWEMSGGGDGQRLGWGRGGRGEARTRCGDKLTCLLFIIIVLKLPYSAIHTTSCSSLLTLFSF